MEKLKNIASIYLLTGRKKTTITTIICGLVFLLTGCDKITNVEPPIPPTIPQPTAEVFKQGYSDVREFIFKPIEANKTWQTDFIAPTGKIQALVDYQGEIIDLNELVGTPKLLPVALKQFVNTNYPNAQIVIAYDLMKSNTQTDGYKLVIQTSKTAQLNLFFDANNNFLKEEKPITLQANSIVYTSTYQVNFDDKIPPVVKQFVSNNQLKNASVAVYGFGNDTHKIVLNYWDRLNGALQTAEITLSSQGTLLEWVSSIENEYLYKSLKINELPIEVSNYLNANVPNWQFDYGIIEASFGKNTTNFATIKSGIKERIVVIDGELDKNDLMIIRTQVLTENDLPPAIKNSLTYYYPDWVFTSGSVVYEPYFPATKSGGTMADRYQMEIKQNTNTNTYTIRLTAGGKLIFKYRN